jgi:hypothetical protein
LLDEALGGNCHFPPTLNFLVRFHDIQRSNRSGLGAAFDLFEPVFCNPDCATLDLKKLHSRNPIPKLRGCRKKEVLSGLCDPDIRARVRQF